MLTGKNKKGFTVVELLIVIAVLAILFIVILSKVNFAGDRAKDAGVLVDFRSYQIAVEQTLREKGYRDNLPDLATINNDIKSNLDKKLYFELIDGEYQSKVVNPYGFKYVLKVESGQIKVYSVNEQSKSVLDVGQSFVYADEMQVYSNGSVLIWGDKINAGAEPVETSNKKVVSEDFEIDKFKNVDTLTEQDVQANLGNENNTDNPADPGSGGDDPGDNPSDPGSGGNNTGGNPSDPGSGGTPTQYTLTASASANDGTAGGVVTPTTDTGSNGTEVTLVANAYSGYQFMSWTDAGGSVVSNNPTYVATIKTSGNDYTANFGKLYYWSRYSVNSTTTGYTVKEVIKTRAATDGGQGALGGNASASKVTIKGATYHMNYALYQVNGSISTPLLAVGDVVTLYTNFTPSYTDGPSDMGGWHLVGSDISALGCDEVLLDYDTWMNSYKTTSYWSINAYLLTANQAYSKGTLQGTVSSTNPSEYPANGKSAAFWYVAQ